MSGINLGFISSKTQDIPNRTEKSEGRTGASLWEIGSKTLGTLSTVVTTVRSKTLNVIRTVGIGAKATLRVGGVLAFVLYDATKAGLRGLAGKRPTPEQTAEMWKEVLLDSVEDVVQEKVADGLETLEGIKVQDEILSVSSQQSKKMKVDYVRDMSKSVESQSGISHKLLSSFLASRASSMEESVSESVELDKNQKIYGFFCRFIIPLLQKNLDENSIKMILGQYIGLGNKMIIQFDAYAKEYRETHETFDSDSFVAGLAEQFNFSSLEQLKENSTKQLTYSLEKIIDKTRATSGPTSVKESAVLWAASKVPTTFIGIAVRAALETLETHFRNELLEKLLPFFQEFLPLDALKEKTEICLTIFFWNWFVPALVQVVDSIASSPTHPPENVINRHLEKAVSTLMETLGTIIQKTSIQEGATLSVFIEQFESPKGKNTTAQLIKDSLKDMITDSARSIPLSSIKNGIEHLSNRELGGKHKLYTIAGQAIMKSIDLPNTVGSIVQILKHIISQ